MQKTLHLLLTIAILVMFFLPCNATTVSDLISQFRERTGELDTAESFYSDSTAKTWFALAQYKVMMVGNLLERCTTQAFIAANKFMSLPTDFRTLKEVWVSVSDSADRKWVGPYPPVAVNPYDTVNMQFSIVWSLYNNPMFLIKPGNLLPVYTDIIYDADSLAYDMPSNYNTMLAAMVRQRGEWDKAVNNYGFFIDTNLFQYFIGWESVDTARFYFHDIYQPNHADIIYNDDSLRYTMPTDFRMSRNNAVMVRKNDEWQKVINNFGFLIDTNLYQYFITWDYIDTARFYFHDMYRPQHTNIIYNSDSVKYTMPTDFRKPNAVALYSNVDEQWYGAIVNPYFQSDTNYNNYFFDYLHPDTVLLYFESHSATDGDTIRVWYDGLSMINGDTIRVWYNGLTMTDGDTIRLFYNRTIQDGDSVNIVFYASPQDLDSSSTNYLKDYDPFVIEEVMSYYEAAKRDKQSARAIWEQLRIDMGLLKPKGEKQE